MVNLDDFIYPDGNEELIKGALSLLPENTFVGFNFSRALEGRKQTADVRYVSAEVRKTRFPLITFDINDAHLAYNHWDPYPTIKPPQGAEDIHFFTSPLPNVLARMGFQYQEHNFLLSYCLSDKGLNFLRERL